MLRVCYLLVQVIEILFGAWMVHNLYPEFRKDEKWIQGVWIAGCMILCISYVGSTWNSFISNISIIVFSLQFAGVYWVCHKVKFFKKFWREYCLTRR